MKRYVLLIAAMVGLTAGCQAASPSFSSFYTNHFLTNGLVIKANLNPTQFDTNASSITITITNVSGISGGSHWTNPVGVLKPRSGQTTNVLTFVSGSADNATNTALVVGTVNAWTDANAKLLTLRDVGTDVFYVTPHGSVEIGRSIAPWWLPDEGDILAGVHDVSQGDSDRSVLHIAAVDDAVSTVNFASHTVTLQSGANAQVASTTKAEVGGVESRITVALVPDQGTADFEIINTGNETFKVNSNSGTFVHNILWALDAFAMPPSLSSNLVVGVNNIDTENEGVFNLVGPNTNPAATFVNLGNGNGVGNFFIVINNAQNSAFTMQDGDPLWDNASAYMRLNGNFVSTNRGDAIFLYHNGWFIAEIGRSYGNTNVASPSVMNPTDLYIPYRQTEGVFADSPFYLTATGSTNVNAKGTIYSGLNSFSLYGDSDLSLVQYRDVSIGDADTGGLSIYTQIAPSQAIGTFDLTVQTNLSYLGVGWNDGPSAGRAVNITVTPLDTQFDMSDINGVARVLFQSSETSSTSASISHFVDTDTTWTQGTLFGVRNNSTNAFSVGNQAQLTFGTHSRPIYNNASSVVAAHQFQQGGTNVASFQMSNSGGTEFSFLRITNAQTGGYLTIGTLGSVSQLEASSTGIFMKSDVIMSGGDDILVDTDDQTDIGSNSSNGAFKDLFMKGVAYIQGSNDGSGNNTRLTIEHTGNAGNIEYTSAAAGTQTFRPHLFKIGSTNVAKLDTTSAAGETRFWLYDEDNGTMERVTVGAADSGGVGYKVLRIPN